MYEAAADTGMCSGCDDDGGRGSGGDGGGVGIHGDEYRVCARHGRGS